MSLAADQRALDGYRWAARYIEDLIQGPPSPPPDATREEIYERARARMARLASFLELIGNPERTFRSFHVGGTSGKGSTAAFIASILTAAGYRTGLHVSPYLQVETEKLQIDDRLVSGDAFAAHVQALDALARHWSDAGHLPLTYGEFWVALTFYAFAREGCDVAVIEVGAGGRFDLTNVLLPDVAVITSVGLDHTRTLGETIPEIAWHKAGIIKPGRPAVTAVHDPQALDVIEQEAREQDAPLVQVVAGRDYRFSGHDHTDQVLEIGGGSQVIKLPLPGAFQATNAALAGWAVRAASDLPDGPVPWDVIRKGIENTRLPGRLEVVQERPQVALDGAHNPEKMRSLIQSLPLLGIPGRRILVLGSLGGHDFLKVAEIVAPVADEVIVTAPSAVQRESAPVEDIVSTVARLGVPAEVILQPQRAIEVALGRARTDDQILVTGSLYLVGLVRERWFPSDAIVLERTPWPAQRADRSD
jgi:dihydrofolate synthase / folylpolyglutamate synthase